VQNRASSTMLSWFYIHGTSQQASVQVLPPRSQLEPSVKRQISGSDGSQQTVLEQVDLELADVMPEAAAAAMKTAGTTA
jgi:hypothetical protein